ncbi:MAG TPA: hypothetical protein VK196_04040, partial [Magnetospirillum sp.]|nr:hypothetical protein [Magnetospirillum sp.]
MVAEILSAKGEWEAAWAERDFVRVAGLCAQRLETAPEDKEALYGLGAARAMQRDFSAALEPLERVAATEPGFVEVRPNHFLIDLTPLQVANRLLLARLCAALGRNEDATAHLHVIRHYIIDNFRAQYLLGRCMLRLNDGLLAATAFIGALKIQPGNLVVTAHLGVAFASSGRWTGAMEHLERGEEYFRSRPEWGGLYQEYLTLRDKRLARQARAEGKKNAAPAKSAEPPLGALQRALAARLQDLWKERRFAEVEADCVAFLAQSPADP